MTKDEKFVAAWSRTRRMGKWKFCLFVGITWGILVPLGLEASSYFFGSNYVFEGGSFATRILIYIVLGILAFGQIIWWMNEKKHNKLTS